MARETQCIYRKEHTFSAKVDTWLHFIDKYFTPSYGRFANTYAKWGSFYVGPYIHLDNSLPLFIGTNKVDLFVQNTKHKKLESEEVNGYIDTYMHKKN